MSPSSPLPSTSLRTWWGLFRQSHSSTQESSTRAYDGLPVLWGLVPGGTLGPDAWATGADRKGAGTHLASTAVHDVLWGVVNLGLHMNSLFLLMIHLHPQNSKGRPAKIQGNEISLFCLGRQQYHIRFKRSGKVSCSARFSTGSGPTALCFRPEAGVIQTPSDHCPAWKSGQEKPPPSRASLDRQLQSCALPTIGEWKYGLKYQALPIFL